MRVLRLRALGFEALPCLKVEAYRPGSCLAQCCQVRLIDGNDWISPFRVEALKLRGRGFNSCQALKHAASCTIRFARDAAVAAVVHCMKGSGGEGLFRAGGLVDLVTQDVVFSKDSGGVKLLERRGAIPLRFSQTNALLMLASQLGINAARASHTVEARSGNHLFVPFL